MTQANLWLPGFEFGDALLGSAPQPDYTPIEPVQLGEQVKQEASMAALPVSETTIPCESNPSVESFDEPTAPASIQAKVAAAQESCLAQPPWPKLLPDTHRDLKGQVTKFDANVEAIGLLRQLEAEGTAPDTQQREILNRYTGWGGIKHPFDSWPGTDWVQRAKQLKTLLSDDEFESARGSTLNAHFTPVSIVDHLWSALRRIGFAGGRILEPSAGVGYFLGAMPSDIAQRSSVTAVELDNLSARFLNVLYGSHAKVLHMGFEKANLPESYYDLVISNVPFGNYGVGDLRRKAYSDWAIHNYFKGRSLDLVRPGGLVAIITSAFFMDGQSETVRSLIARKAKLLGAIRFPAGTFADIANTDVVADLVILQKRTSTEILTQEERELWVHTATLLDEDGEAMHVGSYNATQRVNNYWLERPKAVIGVWSPTSRNQGQAIVPKLPKEADLSVEIEGAVKLLPESIYAPATQQTKEVMLSVADASKAVLPGSFVIQDGDIYRFNGHSVDNTGFKGKKAERIAGLARIRDTAQALIKEQCKSNADDAVMASMRYELNVRYDSFVAKHGYISTKGNRQAMASDPTWPLLMSLEFFNQEDETATKADIFFERTIFSTEMPKSAETAEDALAICVAELGCIDVDFIGRLLADDGNRVLSGLAATGAVFVDPVSMSYQVATEYLSGNVREKLAVAQTAGPAFDRNVHALEKSLPADLGPTDIDVIPGAVWIPTDVTEAFLKYLVDEEWRGLGWTTLKIKHESATGTWSVITSGPIGIAMGVTWGTQRVNGFTLFEKSMNQQDAEVFDQLADDTKVLNAVETAQARLKQDELRLEYGRWIWADDERAKQLCRIYNDKFNCWALRQFDGSRLRLPGYSKSLGLREFQLNAVARISTGCNTLLSHVVGAGKTITMVCGSMELRRLGIAKKPFHVVPNHCLMQYCAEFMRAYPNASLLMATKADFEKDKRQAFAAKCATGNWDAVVLTHSMFERIGADQAIVQDYLERTLNELRSVKESSALDRTAARAVNRFVKDWEARLEKLQAIWKKDQLISLTETGCDWLFFDECHVAKNLFRISGMKSIAGLSNSNSQRSFDLLLKCMQLMRLHGDKERGLCFSSGTIISNTMAEMHVAQRYLQPFVLEKAGLDKFDSWAAQFGRAVNSMEVSPDGSSFRMNRRFKQFVNMPELMGLFRQVADVQTKEMLKLPVPKLVTGSHQICVVKPSQEVKEYVASLVERAEAVRNRLVKPDEDNMLAITGDGQKAALDMRLINPHAKFDPQGKIARCVDIVFRIWEQTAGFKGTQIVFSDMGTPTGRSLNVYEDIRKRLVAKGIPQHEIVFIHEANTDQAKSALFARVRAGTVRVLIGSTSKCGMGTNVQTRLYAVHHLTTPWRPSDIEQRDGRIERQGNTCEEIEVWRFVTEGTFDAYMWQTLTAKAGFIAQVMSGNAEMRSVEDAMMATLSYDEVKAIACGNPAVREKAMLDAEIMGLSLKQKHHNESVWKAKEDLWRLPMRIAENKRLAIEFAKFHEEIMAGQKLGAVIEVNGKKFSDYEKVEKIITLSIQELRTLVKAGVFSGERLIGTLCGVDLFFMQSFGRNFEIVARSKSTGVKSPMGGYATGNSIIRKVAELGPHMAVQASDHEGRVQYLTQQQPVLERMTQTVFADSERLVELRARSRKIALDLGLLKDMAGADGVAGGTDIKSALAADLVIEEVADEVTAEATEDNEELLLAEMF
jgi:N12 class adenine-specific DNA methylase